MAGEQPRNGAENALRTPRAAGGSLPSAWRHTLQGRLLVAAVLFGLWTAGVQARLLYLQVVQHDDMQARADRQHNRLISAPAKRGEIVDRNGHVLAYSVDADTIFADPGEVEDPDEAARLICGAIEGCTAKDRREMAADLRRDSQFVYIARKVSLGDAERVRKLGLKGIAFLKESRRYYPKKELAAHVLGYVGLDNTGLAGLESAYDSQVRGREGKIFVQTDARQHALTSRIERAPTAGASLELTIDQYLQYIAERELREGVRENRAAGGTALVMDPNTGEILALANAPTFNPNAFGRYDEKMRRNRAIQDLYEPGSTFKIVTASAALEEHVIDSDDLIDCGPGRIAFGSRVIDEYGSHNYGVLPFTDVIVKSSNVGAIKVGLRLGPERLGRYVSRFGFGQTISPDFRGESPGIVWNPARLDASALASVAMGYQVGVTPLQMAAAVSSVANGGSLIEPRVVRAVIKDGRRVPVAPRVIRKTISPETAMELTSIMEAVVDRGTAKGAQIEGYTIAGKTGTASKLVDGRYSRSDYNASFVGFVPSRQPALTIIVVIDSPHAGPYAGGAVAAPIFKRIAEASLRHLGIAPTINALPPVLASHTGAGAAPVVQRTADVPDVVEATLASVPAGVMPDLRGLSAREALRTLTRIGASARMVGQGVVVEQTPAAGEPLADGDTGLLKLDRRAPAPSPPIGGAAQ